MIQDSGELVCGDCGFVSDRMMDTGPESRGFRPEEAQRMARTGAPVSLRLSDQGMTTIIGGGGVGLSHDKWQELNTLRQSAVEVQTSAGCTLLVVICQCVGVDLAFKTIAWA